MTNEENPLDYFKNLTCGPADHIMSLQDMDKVIKFHEEELAAEDKRVDGTDEYPNYGDDFADMVYIARRLLDENTALAANQCHAGYAGEHGHHRCGEIDRLTKERDEARRELCRDEATIRLQRHRVHRDSEDVVGLAKEIAVERGWDCFGEKP